MENMVVNKSAVKDFIQKKETKVRNVAGEFFIKLNQEVMILIDKAIERAEANKRQTVMDKDL